jgi:CRP-like cAMP-binding protein
MDTQPAPRRSRAFDESPALAERAVELLRRPQAALPLTEDEARTVVACMRFATYPTGSLLFREGDATGAGHLLLLLEGQVTVDTEQVPISILGPGSIVGEMAFFDGAPRSANCTALSHVLAAGLSRVGLEHLLESNPRAAAKLLAVLSHFTAERLRALGQQVQMMAEVNEKLQHELRATRNAQQEGTR